MDTGRMFRQHYAVTVDTYCKLHYTKDIPAGADTLSHYCDRGRLFITLGTSPVLLLIKERCFTMISHAFHKDASQRVTIDAHQIVRADRPDHWMSGRHPSI
eukprot:scaffold371_cov84-Skeletonema_dohrnii-CCMP3373.AAC.1